MEHYNTAAQNQTINDTTDNGAQKNTTQPHVDHQFNTFPEAKQKGFQEAYEAITKSRAFTPAYNYFIERWLPDIGPYWMTLIFYFRSLCYYNPQTKELRNTCSPSCKEIADATGISERKINDMINPKNKKGKLTFSLFLKKENRYIYDTKTGRKKQISNLYTVRMTDVPISEEDTFDNVHKTKQNEYKEKYEDIVDEKKFTPVTFYFIKKWLNFMGPEWFTLIIYLRKLCYYNHKTGEIKNTCFPSIQNIVDNTGISKQKVVDMINPKNERDAYIFSLFIKKEHRYIYDAQTGARRRTSNLYTVRMTDPLFHEDFSQLRDIMEKNRKFHEQVAKNIEEIEKGNDSNELDHDRKSGNHYSSANSGQEGLLRNTTKTTTLNDSGSIKIKEQNVLTKTKEEKIEEVVKNIVEKQLQESQKEIQKLQKEIQELQKEQKELKNQLQKNNNCDVKAKKQPKPLVYSKEIREVVDKIQQKFPKGDIKAITTIINETGVENVQNQLKWFKYRKIDSFRTRWGAFYVFCLRKAPQPQAIIDNQNAQNTIKTIENQIDQIQQVANKEFESIYKNIDQEELDDINARILERYKQAEKNKLKDSRKYGPHRRISQEKLEEEFQKINSISLEEMKQKIGKEGYIKRFNFVRALKQYNPQKRAF